VVNFGNTNYGQTAKANVTFGGAPFGIQKSSKIADLADGTSNTLMMAEVITVGDTGTNWGGRSKHPGGVHASFCDGSVRFFSNTTSLATWRALSTARGGEAVDLSDL
jgi:prepilin-type processing-associated H-X9-DG protein